MKNDTQGGEMAQQPRALAALAEDPGSVSSTLMVPTTDRMPASGLCGHCTHTVHRYTRRQKRLYTKKYKFLKTPDELRRVHFQHRKAFLCEQVLQRAFPELVVWVRFNQSNLQNILGGAETV